jgi:hypothetical protein
MTQPFKKLEMLQASEYRFKDKIKPFLRGLLEASPLVEVAIEGLKRAVPEDLRKEYQYRIAKNGTTEQIHAALLAGVGKETQDMFAAAFEHKFNMTKQGYDERVYSSESALSAPGTFAMKDRYIKSTIEQIIRLFHGGKINSGEAQRTFALIIFADGTSEQAKELLACDSVGGQARHILIFKGGDHKGYEA